MGIEYRKYNQSRYDNEYVAVGDETTNDRGDTVRPFARVSVSHQPKGWNIPFKNEGHHIDKLNGLSSEYIGHVFDTLSSPSHEDKMTGLDDDAVQAIDLVKYGNGDTYLRDPDALKYALDTNPHFNPQKLFYEEPSSITVNYMAADPSLKHTALTLGAIAKRDLKADKIIASDDLSPFSSALTKSAIKKGLPVEANQYNPDLEATNDMDLDPRTLDTHDIAANERFFKPVSPELISESRKDLRGMLRNPTPVAEPEVEITADPKPLAKPKTRNTRPVTRKGLSDQFVIPGMEKFL